MEGCCVKMALSEPQEHELNSGRFKPGTGLLGLYYFSFIIILGFSLQMKIIFIKLHLETPVFCTTATELTLG
jgi:hypothetical protein